ncbi:PREDICTED: uncharacterized protein LOC109238161 [Nicotiana attenuata]|uniref:uncharacterized protein LOC109238161 n=1 Tax=Nicotiana attenuata TaxID=49451 RepID=UPI0009052820|nr:PREDICTED: uncharacterized protein LOC109238161 [Nicotiana attenuata]
MDVPAVIGTSRWTKSVMLKACKVFGVNVVGFEHEIFAMVLRMEQKRQEQVQKQKTTIKAITKGKKKQSLELERLRWGMNYNDIVCLQETKIEEWPPHWIRQVWGNRWVDWAVLNSIGRSGGIIVLWDKRKWLNRGVHQGHYTISCMFESAIENFRWCFIGVYGPYNNSEREILWHELAAIRGIWEDQWVIGGDFNVCRYESERYNCIRRSRAMKSFTDIIQDLGIIDLPLLGAHYTWFREWNDNFKAIKQIALPRVVSHHRPLLLQCGDWAANPSYKFENMWLQAEGFMDKVKEWWLSYAIDGSHDFILMQKLRCLKKDITNWNKESFGQLEARRTKLLEDLALMEVATENRLMTQAEKEVSMSIKLELQHLAKAEEVSWRQKSRCL